jgi:stage V sporulation protein G
MKITEVKVYAAKDGGRLKAYATIVFDNVFIVRDLKVIEDQDGFFVSMPSRRRKDGTFRDIAHPLNSEMRKMIESSVVAEYQRAIGSGDMRTQNPDDID